jgi:hypothetical protein
MLRFQEVWTRFISDLLCRMRVVCVSYEVSYAVLLCLVSQSFSSLPCLDGNKINDKTAAEKMRLPDAVSAITY